jgi:hypothetical protein
LQDWQQLRLQSNSVNNPIIDISKKGHAIACPFFLFISHRLQLITSSPASFSFATYLIPFPLLLKEEGVRNCITAYYGLLLKEKGWGEVKKRLSY